MGLCIGLNTPVVKAVDKLGGALTTSKKAYDEASANQWLEITEAEYNNLATTVSGSAKHGLAEEYFKPTDQRFGYPSGGGTRVSRWEFNLLNADTKFVSKIPSGHYIYALHFIQSKTNSDTEDNPLGSNGSMRVTLSKETAGGTDTTSTNVFLGSNEVKSGSHGYGHRYFILKAPTRNFSYSMNLGYQSGEYANVAYDDGPGDSSHGLYAPFHSSYSGGTKLPWGLIKRNSVRLFLQSLSTPNKQW